MTDHLENELAEVHVLPPLVISAEDYGRLAFIATASMMGQRRPAAGAVLADELVRATVMPAADVPPSVVTMGSTVEFRDDATGRVSQVTLVYPGEEYNDVGLVSVLTPIGAALIGMSEGQSIRWRSAVGDWRYLTVLRVSKDTSPTGGQQGRPAASEKWWLECTEG